MSDDIRFQEHCYYASPSYAESFWGKYIYLYQGKGSLCLTSESLCLEGTSQVVEIPLREITSISLGRFSSLAKPFGLTRLTISYLKAGRPDVIHLVPYESMFAPTWVTSQLVASWFETLGNLEELADKIRHTELQPEPPKALVAGLMLAAFAVAPLLVASVAFLFFNAAR